MKARNGIGWILCNGILLIILVVDLWTGKLPLDQWLKILLASIMGGMIVVAIMRKYVQKERERTREKRD